MKSNLIALVAAFSLSVATGFFVIPLLKKLKAGQTILKYVEEHKEKEGTPTMGGLFFILPSCAVFFLTCGIKSRLSNVCVTIGLAFLAVGFIDDFIKIKGKKNEGLKPYQKIFFQLLISVFAGAFCYVQGITDFFIPFADICVDLGLGTIFLVPFVFVSITNSVNLTDGLDGLAGSVSAVYLAVLVFIVAAQMNLFGDKYTFVLEREKIVTLSYCLIGGSIGFLCFNVNKAKVFMGDTGSLSLGAFIGAISIFTGNAFFIPLIGIMFVLSSISVIVQVAHYKRTKRRVLLMAPLHHHFQHKGYTETKISFVYSVVTAMVGLMLAAFYL